MSEELAILVADETKAQIQAAFFHLLSQRIHAVTAADEGNTMLACPRKTSLAASRVSNSWARPRLPE
jgi:hypothetical protein